MSGHSLQDRLISGLSCTWSSVPLEWDDLHILLALFVSTFRVIVQSRCVTATWGLAIPERKMIQRFAFWLAGPRPLPLTLAKTLPLSNANGTGPYALESVELLRLSPDNQT